MIPDVVLDDVIELRLLYKYFILFVMKRHQIFPISEYLINPPSTISFHAIGLERCEELRVIHATKYDVKSVCSNLRLR